MASRSIPVFGFESLDYIVMDVSPEQAEHMVARNQARWIRGHRNLRLTMLGESNHGRTRTSRGGVLAAIGRSQVYTYTIDHDTGMDRRRVLGFKNLHNEERDIFNNATLGCMTMFLSKSVNHLVLLLAIAVAW
jgi:hypothetical protein